MRCWATYFLSALEKQTSAPPSSLQGRERAWVAPLFTVGERGRNLREPAKNKPFFLFPGPKGHLRQLCTKTKMVRMFVFPSCENQK